MLKIYGVPISVHTRKVIVAAIEKKLPYENEPVIPFNPPPGWADLSPTGKIPVVTDGDVTLCDSSVICAYLERAHPDPPLYPAETRDYVQALWFEEYADGTIFREVVHGLFFQKVIRPKILKQPGDQAAIDAILKRGGADGVRLSGERRSPGSTSPATASRIADIAVVSNLINFHYLGYAIDARRYPQLAAFFKRQTALPAMAAALAAEQPVAAQMGLDRGFMGAAVAA